MNLQNEQYTTQLKQGEKLLGSKWNVFKQISVKGKMGKYKKLIEEINTLFMDEQLNLLLKQAFSGKPVTGINVNINDSDKTTTSNYKGTFF